MKDLASCYGDHAVRVSDSSCSGSGGGGVPTTRSAVSSCLYRTTLSTQKSLLIRVTWTRSLLGQGLSVGVEDPKDAAVAASSVLLRRKRGSKMRWCGDYQVALRWDVSSARYGSGPEPEEGFYLLVAVDSELVLLLGDRSSEQRRKMEAAPAAASSATIVSRREQATMGSRRAQYWTRARFGEGGADHEIRIRCREEPGLSVYVDGKRVALVRRLRWNFRGNRTVFVDGSPVDLMWDVHDWLFAAGRAAFMFRTRSGPETRLWLFEEEELLRGDEAFSLLILAFRSP